MWGLLLTTVLTSAADSLNPIAITQQFVLQGLVKKPKYIWYFIIPTGVTNLIGGFFAYFGLVALMGSFLNQLIAKYGQMIYTMELILGIAFLIGTGLLFQNRKIESLKRQICSLKPSAQNENGNEEADAKRKIKSVSPTALVALGVGATISELSTALPYFAFLAVLLSYRLTLLQVTFILVVYNTIYTLPLIVLYYVYRKAQSKFDLLYGLIKTRVAKWGSILAPTVIGMIGVVLIYHSVSLLLK